MTDDEFVLPDPDTGVVVKSFSLPMKAMYESGKYIASYSIKGIQILNPTAHWENKAKRYREEYELREQLMSEVFSQKLTTHPADHLPSCGRTDFQ